LQFSEPYEIDDVGAKQSREYERELLNELRPAQSLYEVENNDLTKNISKHVIRKSPQGEKPRPHLIRGLSNITEKKYD
jgi:hypothetical protein